MKLSLLVPRCHPSHSVFMSLSAHLSQGHNITFLAEISHSVGFLLSLHTLIFICLCLSASLRLAWTFLLTMRLFFLSQQMLQRRHESFGELLQTASTIGDLRNCPVSSLCKVHIVHMIERVLWKQFSIVRIISP